MIRILLLGPVLLFSAFTATLAAPVIRKAQGANAAAIQATIDQFRADLGGANNGTGGSFTSGRREINWDDVPDGFASPNAFPLVFFNTPVLGMPRGVVLSTPCNSTGIFLVSADSSNPTATPVRFGNIDPSYPSTFTTNSPERLISTGGNCNITEVRFFIPGTNIPATVSGFGVVFVDVDIATSPNNSMILPFDKNGSLMTNGSSLIPNTFNGGLSFVGVSYNSGERIGSVRIVSGNRSPDTGVIDGAGIDVVVLDDFVYGEPRAAEFHSGDADGDGVADPRIFRPGSATWYSLNSGSGAVSINGFGANGDIPIDGDFDGDSRADLCVFRPSNGSWWFLRSATGTVFVTVFGQNGDQPVAADYDKDGRTDIAFWRPSNGNYYILRSSTDFTSYYAFPFGQAGDIPVK